MHIVHLTDFFSPAPVDDIFPSLLRPLRFDTPQQTPQIRVDVKEEGSGDVVEGDIPGVSKQDIGVRIEGHQASATRLNFLSVIRGPEMAR